MRLPAALLKVSFPEHSPMLRNPAQLATPTGRAEGRAWPRHHRRARRRAPPTRGSPHWAISASTRGALDHTRHPLRCFISWSPPNLRMTEENRHYALRPAETFSSASIPLKIHATARQPTVSTLLERRGMNPRTATTERPAARRKATSHGLQGSAVRRRVQPASFRRR